MAAFGIWNHFLDKVKAGLVTQDDSTEYLEGFNIYLMNDKDDTDKGLKMPYVTIEMTDVGDRKFPSGEGISDITVVFAFRIPEIGESYSGITSNDEEGDRLMAFILKAHKDYLKTIDLTSTSFTLLNRNLAEVVRMEYSENDRIHTASCVWRVSILDAVF